MDDRKRRPGALSAKRMLAAQIKEAENRKTVLESELIRIEAINTTSNIDENLIESILLQKKNLLLSSNDENKKEVLQEHPAFKKYQF